VRFIKVIIRTIGDFDIWHKPCSSCGFDPAKGGSGRCWKCGKRLDRDLSERALKVNRFDFKKHLQKQQ